LNAAWRQVAKNRGAAGIDRVSIKPFKANKDIYLAELEKDLKTDLYQPTAVRRVHIPKGKGKTRTEGIPIVKDRVVQAALKMVMEPIFEKEFLDLSYGFRPKRGCKDALREVDLLIKEGYSFIVDADISGYFDNIPHKPLIEMIKRHVSDGRLLKLGDKFLRQNYQGWRRRMDP